MEKEKRNEKQRKTGIGAVKTGSRKAGAFSASQGLLRPFWEILRQWREGLWEWFGGEENAGIGKKIGILLGACRILRCTPFVKGGTYDPAPENPFKKKWVL